MRSDGRLEISQEIVELIPRRLTKVLWVLAEAHADVVPRSELLQKGWENAELNDENLTRAIADLRKIFSAHGLSPISSVYGRGYRLDVSATENPSQLNVEKAEAICEEAWHRFFHRQLEGLDVAERLFNLAAEYDKRSSTALRGLAETQFQRMAFGYRESAKVWPTAKIALQGMLELNPNDISALALLGLGVMLVEWDFDTAREYLTSAHRLSPLDYAANGAFGWYCICMGNFPQAEWYLRRAIEARPLSMEARGALAFVLLCQNRPKDALHEIGEAYGYDPTRVVTHIYLSLVESLVGDTQRGLSFAERADAATEHSVMAKTLLSYALCRLGRYEDARHTLSTTLPDGKPVGAHPMAAPTWVQLREEHRAIEVLRIGAETRSALLLITLRDPRLSQLHKKTAFQRILKTVFGDKSQIPTG